MSASDIRVYRQKIASTGSMRKIFNAMELIATSRIGKARERVAASTPYANAITRAVSAVSSQQDIDHVLTSEVENPTRSAVLIMAADRGMAGAYSANVLRHAEELLERLKSENKEADLYLIGRKAQAYFDFRRREYKKLWTGNTDNPEFSTAKEVGETLVDAFLTDTDQGGVDEIHVVFTEFRSLVSQVPTVVRLLPLEVVEEEVTEETELLPLYEYEPDPEQVLDALLPKYIESRIFSAMLQASASELASRQRAMKSAGDNATDLIREYTLEMNNARQASITQELTELIAGADALG
ncbi:MULTISPECIES: F0F1 ATP synthase subunit gamma [Auritidibacter]|uniref:ATP synthase gamma chain n=1 Tax=Auritidibacter ignavus TaxID=678932 RepID=A0AAJ6DCE2_9MICC|nr:MULTISPECIES: F0F1 ATP synthase subunit gamma [Auritidibacter]PXA76222.1 F0F1 ATP synthase subunit gamma [Auritidibacter sp. NML120779]AXR73236.1 F0F1 ATP synthase subunit gamma [Auritidibacter sp. NML130574]NIH71005.1 F-type H+-transporting ATPase subunit gamma [Auritidibacter ignavus]PXA77515.1 F0F1 ATP synthase subunit gamma [Auritidibacter sp. NML100628]PXA81991.1 F0F1 ATP synthase subunit gamma [Auritidibacter sp. NML120636]